MECSCLDERDELQTNGARFAILSALGGGFLQANVALAIADAYPALTIGVGLAAVGAMFACAWRWIALLARRPGSSAPRALPIVGLLATLIFGVLLVTAPGAAPDPCVAVYDALRQGELSYSCGGSR